MPMSYPVNPEREYKTGRDGGGFENSKIARSQIFFGAKVGTPKSWAKESRLEKHFAFNRDREKITNLGGIGESNNANV